MQKEWAVQRKHTCMNVYVCPRVAAPAEHTYSTVQQLVQGTVLSTGYCSGEGSSLVH